jgi:dUTP pyrophosphatase
MILLAPWKRNRRGGEMPPFPKEMLLSVDREEPVQWEVLPHAEDLPDWEHGTEHAAGRDIVAAVTEEVWIAPDEIVKIPTGRKVALPSGYMLAIYSRSGLGTKERLVVAQGVAVIDEDYRGEVFVPLLNTGRNSQPVTRGMRIAQAVLQPAVRRKWEKVDRLTETARGAGGFGSTGTETKV